MNEIQAILAEWQRVGGGTDRQGVRGAALATVVRTKGSAYRRPGARMLITPGGKTVGTLSAGCLENDVVERAERVVARGEPALVRYDTTSGDDLVWGLGIGCKGVVQVLIEPLSEGPAVEQLSHMRNWLEAEASGVVATVFEVEGDGECRVGWRGYFAEAGGRAGELSQGALASRVAADAAAVLRSRRSCVKSYQTPGGWAELFLELIEPPMPLFVFGAGPDAVPLVRFAKDLGWRVTVVDHRPGRATKEFFPAADRLVIVRPEEAAQKVHLDARSAAVLMTHNYAHDLELLDFLLASPAFYIGSLGPWSRAEQLLRDILRRRRELGYLELDRFHGPVGLDIGADSPEEIALSILAEIRAVLSSRAGGMLRYRVGPIHDATVMDELCPSEFAEAESVAIT